MTYVCFPHYVLLGITQPEYMVIPSPTDWVQIEYEYFKTRGHSRSGSQQQLAMFIVIAEEGFVILRNY